jgi:hypothetical protein
MLNQYADYEKHHYFNSFIVLLTFECETYSRTLVFELKERSSYAPVRSGGPERAERSHPTSQPRLGCSTYSTMSDDAMTPPPLSNMDTVQ